MKSKDTWLHYIQTVLYQFEKMQIKNKPYGSDLQTAVIVSVDLQLLKVVNKGHLTNSTVTMINTINNCNKHIAYKHTTYYYHLKKLSLKSNYLLN